MIEIHIKSSGFKYTSITGQVLVKDRQERVDSFNREKGGARVMLLSLAAGGVGLNLTGGNHLVMVDLHWNPALEQQAFDRIYRMGQKKDVFIHRFVDCGKKIKFIICVLILQIGYERNDRTTSCNAAKGQSRASFVCSRRKCYSQDEQIDDGRYQDAVRIE